MHDALDASRRQIFSQLQVNLHPNSSNLYSKTKLIEQFQHSTYIDLSSLPAFSSNRSRTMKVVPILTVLSAAAIGFFIGISFPVEITPKLQCGLLPCGGGGGANSSSGDYISILGRFWAPFSSSNATEAAETPETPKGSERRLPPGIVVSESDLHLRRLWGSPHEDVPTRKYLLALAAGYDQRANVNATIQKFPAEIFDVVVFHYDGRTTEWEEFEWSRRAAHVSARKQTKWWFAKRFLHPSVVAAYEYVFIWDEDLGVETFDPEEYVRIVRKHGLEISQPGLDRTRGTTTYNIGIWRNGSEIHKTDEGCSDVHRPPCSGFAEVMAPVFTKEAWRCVWHLTQNDLVHAWGLDLNFWRCVDDPEEQIGIVDAQYIAHHRVKSLEGQGDVRGDGEKEGSSAMVRARQQDEMRIFNDRLDKADMDLANSTGKPIQKHGFKSADHGQA